MDAPHYVQGQYSVAQRDAIFTKANKYPDTDGGLVNQVPTLTQEGTIIWRQQSSGGGDGTANANIAIVEDTSTASQAYAVGDLLVYSGQLYRVTAAINIGGTITPGTNVTPTTVADELAGGAVSSFNGRTGAVTPQSGDYNASMVGARADDWMPSASDIGALPAPSNTGSVGQVLTKTADGSEWAAGGGGGNNANLAPVEATSTASQAYAVNSFLVYNGQLYCVTAAIAQGDTLTVGANIAAADVGTYLAMVAAANSVANAGVAPGGFGLGVDNLPLATDCNTAKTGWYKTTRADTAHRADSSAGDGVLLSSVCDAETGRNGFQIEKESTLLWFRVCNNGTWGEWCSMNRYLRSGSPWTSEIRTMDFFGTSPIYTKSLGLGNIPATGTTTVAHGIANLDQVLSIQGKLGATPIITAPGVVSITVDTTNVTVVTSGASAGVGVAILEYTKTA